MTTDRPATRPGPATATWPAHVVEALSVLVPLTIYVVVAVRTGLPLGSGLAAIAMIALTQIVPGALVWRVVRPRDGWLVEDLAAGFAIGAGLAVPTQIIAGLTRQRWLAIAIPLAVAAALVAVPATRRRIREARWTRLPWWFTPVVAGSSLLLMPLFLTFVNVNQVRWTTVGVPHIDVYLHQALAGELLNRGPVSWPTVAGEDLGYHWFTHAWIAQVSAASGTEINEVLLRVLPSIIAVFFVLSVAVTALRLTGRPVVGVVATVLALVGSSGNVFGFPSLWLPVSHISPTLALGAPTLLALVTLLALRWRGELHRAAYVLIPFLAIVASGTKGSTTPIVVAGLALAAVAMLVWKRERLVPVLIDLVVVGGSLVLVLILVFHGSSAGLTLGITGSAKQTGLAVYLGGIPSRELVLIASGTAIIGGLTRGAAVFVLPFHRAGRTDPVTWLLMGASIAGAVAVGIFSHPGQSQGYFQLTAIPLAAIGSALGLAWIGDRLGARRAAALAAVAIVAGFALHFGPAAVLGPLRGRQWDKPLSMILLSLGFIAVLAVVAAVVGRPGRRLATVGLVAATTALATGLATFAQAYRFESVPPPANVSLSTSGAVSQAQIDTARYIRDHSGVDDLVMTNRHCTVPRSPFNGCDSRRWLVTAFSERQLLIEGWTATPMATKIAPHGRDSVTVNYWHPELLRLNDGFTVSPTEEARTRLWDLGVRWAYVENTIAHAQTLEPYASLEYTTADASAWRLRPPPGTR